MSIASQAQKFIVSAIKQGLGANETLDILRLTGLGYRRADFLQDFRNLSNIPAKAVSLKSVNKNKYFSQSMYSEGKEYQIHRYRYTAQVSFTDSSTGETRVMYQSVVSDDPLTPSQIEEDAMDGLGQAVESYGHEIDSVYTVEAWHRPGAPW